jgi:hypothetical protein
VRNGTKSTVAGGIDGGGQTVAIVDAFAAPTIEQDADQYASMHDQPAVKFNQILPPHDLSNDSDEIQACDPAGLVRRGDARRRGRPCDGARRERAVRRRR